MNAQPLGATKRTTRDEHKELLSVVLKSERLSAALGAISAEVPHDDVAVRLRRTEIAAGGIDETLRSGHDAGFQVEFHFRRADSTVTTIRFDDVWTLLVVDVDGPHVAVQERLHGSCVTSWG